MRFARYGAAVLLLAVAQPADAQYRRRTQDPTPMWAVSVSAGALFPYEETLTPVQAPPPEIEGRGIREVSTSPWVTLAGRFGRALGFYASVSAARAGDAELSGTDPYTGVPLTGTTEVGTISIFSGGVSFSPVRTVPGVRLEAGPAWLDLGSGGSYMAMRLGASARFLGIGDGGGVFIAWDGYLAGGQYDRDASEYQIRHGHLTGLRAGFEYAW